MSVRTFLIADIRGYSRFTDEYGDEAAGQLAVKFAAAMGDGIEAHGGTMVDARGDEGVAVFASARQAIRAAVDLQARFAEETEADPELPLRVGIGIDSGEAVQLDDGTYRGSALNVAARLCARANGGDVLVSAGTSRLAGPLEGLRFTDRGRVRLKNIGDPVHVFHVSSERDAPAPRPWPLRLLGSPGRPLGWRLLLGVALTAAFSTAGVVYLTSADRPEAGSAMALGPGSGNGRVISLDTDLAALVPASLWKDCKVQAVPEPKAIATAVCVPGDRMPDRWEISSYWNAGDLRAAYEAELRRLGDVRRDSGRCNAFGWGGELQWLHGPGKPGGRTFCTFDGYDAVIVWTHQRLGQPTHRDVLVTAREGGSDHVGLTHWWRPWHHLIGKAQES